MSLTERLAKAANTPPDPYQESADDNNATDAIEETNSNCSTDSDHNEETTRQVIYFEELGENDIPTFAIRMLNMCRELAIICLLMITYAALTKDPPKVSRAPPAYPFFSKDSVVTDWYRGEITKAIEQARSSDIAFVMFYAPWDAESQAARQEFETAAAYMSDYVTFTAVNCWQPNSECRNQYSKVYRWPVLIAYPSHGRGVQYNGPISAPHMIRFLLKVCNPMTRLDEERPIIFEDAYLIANIDASPGSVHFAVLYTTALKYLEKDPLYSISFYVDPVVTSEPLLYLHLWNETLVYSIEEKEWRPDDILQWLFKSFHQVTAWVAPIGSKSVMLSNAIQEGPSLILFTPKNPLQSVTDYYKMLQGIARKYYSCEDNLLINNSHNINVQLQRSANVLQYSHLKAKCTMGKENMPKMKITSHLTPQTWTNRSQCGLKPGKGCPGLDHKMIESCLELQPNKCLDFNSIGPQYLGRVCEGKVQVIYKTSMVTGDKDPRSPVNLFKLWTRDKCKEFVYRENFQPSIFEKELEPNNNIHNISGLACKTNRSLTFVAMDSLLYYHFAERLGIDVTSGKEKSSVAIINEKAESHYIMKGTINNFKLTEFIEMFSNNQLPRSQESFTTLNSYQNVAHVTRRGRQGDKSKIFVKELDSTSFLHTILQKNKAVVVFYYSKQCAFCSGISYIFLSVSQKLSLVEDVLFARVDGETNILPWEYTMYTYPTVLFFPTREKSESRVFPFNIAMTVPNLVRFVLTNLDSCRKLQAMWSLCQNTKLEMEKSRCHTSLQAETLTVIDRTLREWRRSNKRQKQMLLHTLKQLRQLHLLFAYSPQHHAAVRNAFNKLNSKPTHSVDYTTKDDL
ncbi:hypothetical protein NQ315_001447 [Exocentrus adspersus]|uniref:Thioredoxin domain-containing protein n=1 Tax=Exocentrus adspersus TaxID=1586481 RepID=A0AAV8W9K1_9CUCU|nr:hypothetical protein NQ315_001447 [Exocentrus adspersus]